MNGSHVTGASLGALIGYTAAHFGWNVSTNEALAYGATLAMVGGSIAHLFQPPGLIPRVKAALGLAK
jgi:hypothetical protein